MTIIQAIVNGVIFNGECAMQGKAVLLSGDRVLEVVSESEIPADIQERFDLQGGTLVPGFVDLQVNGGGGVLFNNDPSVETIRTIAAAHRRYGTTALLPTLITDDFPVMVQAIAAVRQAIEDGVPGVIGIHIEGPFLSPDRAGAHDASKFCRLDEQGIELVCSLDKGKTLLTLAPELTTSATIQYLVEQGLIIAAGHSAADYEQVAQALEAGVAGFTHLYNAMSPLQGRAPGMVGAALADEASWFGIIADGHHVHPAAFKAAVRAKHSGGALLVTDAMAPVGASESTFALGEEILRASDGRIVNQAGRLAGSALDMLSAVNNAAEFAGIDWFEAQRMASLYPARALGLDTELGIIAAGCRASLLALDKQRCITACWIDGVKD